MTHEWLLTYSWFPTQSWVKTNWGVPTHYLRAAALETLPFSFPTCGSLTTFDLCPQRRPRGAGGRVGPGLRGGRDAVRAQHDVSEPPLPGRQHLQPHALPRLLPLPHLLPPRGPSPRQQACCLSCFRFHSALDGVSAGGSGLPVVWVCGSLSLCRESKPKHGGLCNKRHLTNQQRAVGVHIYIFQIWTKNVHI